MSIGSPRRTLRVPQKLVEEIEQAIDSANARRREQPYDWSAWALKAIREKLAHLARSRGRRRRRRSARQPAGVAPDTSAAAIPGAAHVPPSLV